MSTTTTNYNLIKPSSSDAADITSTNTNWDTIDSKLNELDSDFTTNKFLTVPASSTNGTSYTATIDDLTELKPGISFVIIPNTTSQSTTVTLNVNNLGAKNIRIPLNANTSGTTIFPSTNWLVANKPVRVTYDGTQWKTDVQIQSASNIHGTVPISNGGTGASNVTNALANLGITQGTWKPTVAFNTTSATSYSTQTGTFTKIGNTVILSFNICCVAPVTGDISINNWAPICGYGTVGYSGGGVYSPIYPYTSDNSGFIGFKITNNNTIMPIISNHTSNGVYSAVGQGYSGETIYLCGTVVYPCSE